MDTPITFTPGEVIAVLLGFAGSIITISAAVTVVINLIKRMRKPEEEQNQKIASLEKRLDSQESRMNEFVTYFDRDKKRFDHIEQANEITQEALLALLSHSISGNSIDALTSAKDKLQKYLISRNTITV